MAHTPPLAAVLVFFALTAEPGAADDAAVPPSAGDRWIAHVRQCFDDVASFRAPFVQEITEREGADPIELRGTVEALSDGHVRIEYHCDQNRVFVSNRFSFVAYNPGSRSGTKSRDRSGLLSGLFHLLWGSRTESGFSARHLGGATEPGAGPAAIELVPQTRSEEFERLVLGVEDACPGIRRVLVVDRTGRVNRITLGRIEINAKIPRHRFFLRTPPKTKLIRP